MWNIVIVFCFVLVYCYDIFIIGSFKFGKKDLEYSNNFLFIYMLYLEVNFNYFFIFFKKL